jgi:hypothetical protein
MNRLFRSPAAIARVLRRSYVLLLVDVNRRDGPPRNENIVQRFGEPLASGIPALLVLDGEGRLLNVRSEDRLRDTDHEFPDRVLAFLERWAPTR